MHDIFRYNTWSVLYAFHQRLPEIMNHIPATTNHGLLVMNKSWVIHHAGLFLMQGNMYSCQILALPACIRKFFTERIHICLQISVLVRFICAILVLKNDMVLVRFLTHWLTCYLCEISFKRMPPLTINQYWFRQWFGVVRHQAMTWANVDHLCHHMVSLGHNELTHCFEFMLGNMIKIYLHLLFNVPSSWKTRAHS